MRMILNFVTGFILVAAQASANPLGGPMVDESLKLLQTQSSGGLGLTGETFTPVPPAFSLESNTVIYRESPRGDQQYNISRQKVFRTISDSISYSAGEASASNSSSARYELSEGSYASASNEFPVMIRSHASEVSNEEGGATYALNQDFGDNWAIGSGWLGAEMGYRVTGSNAGDVFSAAWARGTVLGSSTILLGANLTTRRDYKGSTSVGDDTLKYSGNFFMLGQKTQLASGEVKIGYNKVFDEIAHYDQRIYAQEWQYFIGPVPILIRARLSGRASTGKPVVEIGLAPSTTNEISYRGYVQPYAGLRGGGDIVLGGLTSVPENLLPAYAKGVVDSDFISGDILAQGYGTSAGKGACMEVGMGNFRTMQSVIWGEAKWDIVQTEYVQTFVNTICDNGYIAIPGCNGVKSFLEQVTNVLSFKKQRVIYTHPGFDLGSGHKWLEINACRTSVEPTVANLCNDSVEAIHSSLLVFDAANSNWKSIGWYELPPKGCRKISLGNYQGGRVYAYSEYRGGDITWAGSGPAMCVHRTEAFDISNGDQAASCQGSAYKMVNTTEINLPANQTTSHSFGEANFSAFQKSNVQLCNRTFHDTIHAAVTFFKQTWTSKGWWKIDRDQCVNIDLGPYVGNVFIHGDPGTTYGASFGQGWNFCVNRADVFEYPYIETMGCTIDPNQLREFSMFPVKQGNNIYEFRNDDVMLSKRVCNQTSETAWISTAWDETFAQPDGRRVAGSAGWWELAAGGCMDVRHQKMQNSAYVFAINGSGKEFPKQPGANTRNFCLQRNERFNLTETPSSCPSGFDMKPFDKTPGTVYIQFD
jgi:uncharacterized membrane protein